MSLMEGRPDIFQELREKFVDTFKVSFLVEKMRFLSSVSKMHEKEITDFFKRKKFVKLVRLHGLNNALRYFPFDHEFGVGNATVSIQIHFSETFCHLLFFIRNKSHIGNNLELN